jgi:hypothetical protein
MPIAPERIRDLFECFELMQKRPVEGVLVWRYFFTDYSPQRLQQAAETLMLLGYRFVALVAPDPEYDAACYTLWVEREEVHTFESILVRNHELDALAARFCLRDYNVPCVGTLKPN